MVLERITDGLQGRDVALQESQDIFSICHADLLPHDRGGGGALRISFYKEEQKNEAASLLKSHNYVLTK